MSEPTAEDALDGLLDAATYAEAEGLDEIAEEASDLYQRLGEYSEEEER